MQEMMGFSAAVASAGPYANNLHLAPASSVKFLLPGALPGAQPTVSKH